VTDLLHTNDRLCRNPLGRTMAVTGASFRRLQDAWALVDGDERAGASIHVVEAQLVSRAMATATALAQRLDLRVDDVVVIRNSNKVAVRLLPCEVFVRVALTGKRPPRLR